MKKINYLASVILILLFSCDEEAPETATLRPVAAFTFEVDAEDPLTVLFTNASKDADNYLWNFGDESGTSTDENPSYTYAEAGEYSVSLTATGEGGSNEVVKTVTVTAPAGPEGCFLTQIKKTYSDGVVTETLTYDSEGNLIEIVWFDDDGGNSDDEDTESLQLTYTNNKLVSARYLEDGEESEPYSIIYDGEKLSKITTSYEEDGETYIYEVHFFYSGDQVVKVEEWANYYEEYDESTDEWSYYTGDLYLEEVAEFTYTNGNLVKTVSKDFEEHGSLEYQETEEFTYDDKTNPLKGNLAWFIWEGEFDIYFSNNNPVTHSWEYIDYKNDEDYNGDGVVDDKDNQSYSGSTMLDYDYNENGLPVEISDDEGDVIEIIYECN